MHSLTNSHKKSGRASAQPPVTFMEKMLLWKADCLRRTNISACTTFCAHIRIDRILFSFRDSANRALVDTCTACDTIVTNYVSHSLNIFIMLIMLLYNQTAGQCRLRTLQRYIIYPEKLHPTHYFN